MATTVRSRPNHYELLGLTPTATDEEIRQAFAREIGPHRPRALGGTAAISVAFATLRDPARRRDYDASLGLTPKPAPAPRLEGWHFAGHVRVSRPGQPPDDAPPRDESKPAPEAQLETSAHAPPEPFIAEPAPSPARAEPHVEPEPPRRSGVRPGLRPAPQAAGLRARPVPMEMRILPMEEARGEWKRPALLAVGLFLLVALLGVLAGLWASRDVGQQAPEAAVTIPPAPSGARTASMDPPAPARPGTAAPAGPPANAQPLTRRESRRSTAMAEARRGSPRPQPELLEEQRAEDVPEIPAEQVAALTSQAAAVQAKMPLSDAAVARTISRIGYSCGEVASMTAVEGASGAFKVTCTSGQSYKATPVRGRYRFRRWAG